MNAVPITLVLTFKLVITEKTDLGFFQLKNLYYPGNLNWAQKNMQENSTH